MRNLARLVLISALTVGCNNNPTSPPGTGGPSTIAPGHTTPVQTSGLGATAAPDATGSPAEPAPQSAQAKIEAARANGAIDEPTSLLYRLYASVNDDRLPLAYQGDWSEDAAVAVQVRQVWPSLTADQRAALLPFMVRPSSPRSVWAPTASAGTKGSVQLASVRSAASTCQDGFIRKQVSAAIPVLVWGQCGGMTEPQVEALVDEVRQHMTDLWTPMTGFMGLPIGDENDPLDDLQDSAESGDGLLDIYLVDTSLTLHGRALTSGTGGTTYGWPPAIGASGAEASSSYIVIDPLRRTGIQLKGILAHEFFHALQDAHNDIGTYDTDAPGGARQHFWFVEASAQWAEQEFVPQDHHLVKRLFTDTFQATGAGLSWTNSENEYASFVWPLFMQQELGRDSIAHAWSAFEGQQGYDKLSAALDGILSFKGRFRDFAVRVWNQDLQPGSPIDPRFQKVEGDLPISQPSQWRLSDHNGVGVGGSFSASLSVLNLWSKYWVIEPAADVKSLSFDFSTMAPSDYIDVDLLLKIDGTWQRRSGSFGQEEKICNVTGAIVVISNHETARDRWAGGAWSVSGDGNTCNAKGSWSATLTGPAPGAGQYAGTGDILCSAVSLNGGALQWSATMIDLTGTISQISIGNDGPGRDSILVQTPGGIEGGQWFFTGTSPNTTVHVAGSGNAQSAQVSGDATFTDQEGHVFTAHVTMDCSNISL